MVDLYDRVRPPSKQRDPAMTLGVLFCLVLAAALLVLVTWIYWRHSRFSRFLSDLSESTVYAYENDCLRSYVNGDDVWVEQDHIYKLYNSITGAGSGRVTAVPEGEPDVLLDYGEGSTLSIWRVMLTNANHTTSPGLYLLYEGRNGTRYGYDSSKLSTAPLIYLSLIDNRPWSERT